MLYSESGHSSRFSPSTTVCDYDMELEQIVDDVEDMMYREQQQGTNTTPTAAKNLDMQHQEANIGILTRNLPNDHPVLMSSNFSSKDTQDIAEEIARSLVEKALEQDRKKAIRNRQEHQQTTEDQYLIDNYIEVAANRALEAVVNILLDESVSDVSNQVIHGCSGQLSLLKTAPPAETGSTLLADELADLCTEFIVTLPERDTPVSFGLYRPLESRMVSDEDYLIQNQTEDSNGNPARWRGSQHLCTSECEMAVENKMIVNNVRRPDKIKSKITTTAKPKQQKHQTSFVTAKKRREEERRKRNSAGLLLSSLKRKVYHCRCVDCQAERRAQGMPEPSTSIELKDVELPPQRGRITIPKPKGRGRPRIYPRVEDLWIANAEQNDTQLKLDKKKNSLKKRRMNNSKKGLNKDTIGPSREEQNVDSATESVIKKRGEEEGENPGGKLLLAMKRSGEKARRRLSDTLEGQTTRDVGDEEETGGPDETIVDEEDRNSSNSSYGQKGPISEGEKKRRKITPSHMLLGVLDVCN